MEKMNEIYFRIVENVKHGKLDQIILRMWDAQIEGNRFKFEEAKTQAIKKIASIHNELYALGDMVQNSTLEEK